MVPEPPRVEAWRNRRPVGGIVGFGRRRGGTDAGAGLPLANRRRVNDAEPSAPEIEEDVESGVCGCRDDVAIPVGVDVSGREANDRSPELQSLRLRRVREPYAQVLGVRPPEHLIGHAVAVEVRVADLRRGAGWEQQEEGADQQQHDGSKSRPDAHEIARCGRLSPLIDPPTRPRRCHLRSGSPYHNRFSWSRARDHGHMPRADSIERAAGREEAGVK